MLGRLSLAVGKVPEIDESLFQQLIRRRGTGLFSVSTTDMFTAKWFVLGIDGVVELSLHENTKSVRVEIVARVAMYFTVYLFCLLYHSKGTKQLHITPLITHCVITTDGKSANSCTLKYTSRIYKRFPPVSTMRPTLAARAYRQEKSPQHSFNGFMPLPRTLKQSSCPVSETD